MIFFSKICFMALSYKKSKVREAATRRFLFLVLLTLMAVLVMIVLLRINSVTDIGGRSVYELDEYVDGSGNGSYNYTLIREFLKLPRVNEFSIRLEKLNQYPPRNSDLYPNLADGHVVIVLYVHNRPQYLKLVVESLSKVIGISETLLVVSHDGYYEEMNRIVESIKFCQVKHIFAAYSPHVFTDSFPGESQRDCKDKDDARKKKCVGNPDQYGTHRAVKTVSLKHHWWWMMNTIWDGLKETRGHNGHIVFIEEDHFIFPNAYRNLQKLIQLKARKCPDCHAANLAPLDVNSRGEGWDKLIAERMGNIGYSFNRSVWERIHKKSRDFCFFDDYNWDITMWTAVYPSFGSPVYTLRGSRTSAVHFGKCGLHQGNEKKEACVDSGKVKIQVDDFDEVVNIKSEWDLHVYEQQSGYKAGFKGWGGWGDERDRQLCLNFARMYRSTSIGSNS